MKKILLTVISVFISIQYLNAQCAFTVNSFPYQEDFELNNGGWVSGGVLNDWAWGAPSKTFISNAGSGTKCWLTGGLSGNFYNYNERSYLVSPCFDFTNVPFPHVKFKIYWETENIYDGITFQYSLNNGATWTNVGTNNDPVNCTNDNWFNQPNINGLSTLATPQQGWAGTSLPTMGSCNGGSGSLTWVTAKHSMTNLGGQPNVQFRFAFGAGSLCNDYNGVAIDDIVISNAPPIAWVSVAPNNISCNGNNSGSINALASGAGPFNYHLDPVNLTNNNGTFNSLFAGNYTVTATDANGCTISSTLLLIQPNPIVFSSLNSINQQCYNDASGSIQVQYIGGNGALNYTLYPTGATNNNGQFNGLNAGTYTVVVTDASGCTKSTTAALTSPPPIILSEPVITNPSCNPNDNGQIVVNALGGVPPLSYSNGGAYSPSGTFSNLTAGTYTITVKDAIGCTVSTVAQLQSLNAPQFSTVSTTPASCGNSADGALSASANGVVPIILYEIIPTNATNATGTFPNLSPGTYTVIATDANSCTNSTSAIVSSPEPVVFQYVEHNIGKGGGNLDAVISSRAFGGASNFVYTLMPGNAVNNTGTFSDIQSAGTYTVTAADSKGCSISSSIKLEERICCEKLILPNAFSPNGDMKNDEFKILNLLGIDLKLFTIYNRWGGIAFNSQNINDSWDGKIKGIEAEVGNYFYIIKYVCTSSGKEYTVTGDVTLVR